MSWDVKKYNRVLNKIKEDGTLNGTPIKSKEAIYNLIASTIFVSRHTAKDWIRPTSPGPGDQETVRALEKMLGIPSHSLSLSTEAEKEDISEMAVNTLTDANKQALFKMYELMKEYLHDDNLEYEDCFSHMWYEIQKYRILVPNELFSIINDFIDNYLAPIIYEPEITYAACYTDEIGNYNDEGAWVVKSEEARKQMCINFMLKNIEIEEALDRFAVKELQPYLI